MWFGPLAHLTGSARCGRFISFSSVQPYQIPHCSLNHCPSFFKGSYLPSASRTEHLVFVVAIMKYAQIHDFRGHAPERLNSNLLARWWASIQTASGNCQRLESVQNGLYLSVAQIPFMAVVKRNSTFARFDISSNLEKVYYVTRVADEISRSCKAWLALCCFRLWVPSHTSRTPAMTAQFSEDSSCKLSCFH